MNIKSSVKKEVTSPWVVVVIKEWRLPTVLDFGSSRSFMRRDVFERMKQLGLSHSVEAVQDSCVTASGQSCEMTDAIFCSFKIQSFSWKFKLLVFDQCPVPCILGTDLMSFAKVRLLFTSHCYSSGFKLDLV